MPTKYLKLTLFSNTEQALPFPSKYIYLETPNTNESLLSNINFIPNDRLHH